MYGKWTSNYLQMKYETTNFYGISTQICGTFINLPKLVPLFEVLIKIHSIGRISLRSSDYSNIIRFVFNSIEYSELQSIMNEVFLGRNVWIKGNSYFIVGLRI